MRFLYILARLLPESFLPFPLESERERRKSSYFRVCFEKLYTKAKFRYRYLTMAAERMRCLRNWVSKSFFSVDLLFEAARKNVSARVCFITPSMHIKHKSLLEEPPLCSTRNLKRHRLNRHRKEGKQKVPSILNVLLGFHFFLSRRIQRTENNFPLPKLIMCHSLISVLCHLKSIRWKIHYRDVSLGGSGAECAA